jgi:hypothetical protein
MSEPITNLPDAVAAQGALPMPVVPEPQALPLAGPICTQAEARAAGLDIAPSVEELDAMASSIVAVGDPLSAEVSLAQAVPLLGAAVTGLRARVAELEAERKKYVGVEPTVAEEMAYLSRCLDAVYDLCDETAAKGIASGGPFTVEAVRIAADGDRPAVSRPALPWAHAMSDHDLHGFLDDLVSAAMGRWRSEPEVPDRTVLADIERVCADWRTPGAGHRLDGSEFDGVAVRLAEPEPEFHGSLHHSYRLGHDLPETGGEVRG